MLPSQFQLPKILQLSVFVIYRGNAANRIGNRVGSPCARTALPAPIQIRGTSTPAAAVRPTATRRGWLWKSRGRQPCPASPHRRRPHPPRPCACSLLSLLRLRGVVGCRIARCRRCGEGEEPRPADGMWCCGSVPRPASPWRPVTADLPGYIS